MYVEDLKIREIFTTTGLKTIELELRTRKGVVRASVPMGTSVGKYEVAMLPSEQVVRNFVRIREHFVGKFFDTQEEVDRLLRLIDNTQSFSQIGGNLALSISAACLKGLALERGQEVFEFLLGGRKATMPKPLANMIGGWRGQSDVQEYLLFPIHQDGFSSSISTLAKIYREIAAKLKTIDPGFNFGKNIESAWISTLPVERVLKLLAGFVSQGDMLRIGLDFAASQLWDGKSYSYPSGERLGKSQQLSYVEDLVRRYPIAYVEDPFHEDDFVSFSVLTHRISPKLVCGDDLFSTNLGRLRKGIEHKAANAILLKPNQIGTITDVMRVAEEAKKAGMVRVFSHRSGETEDVLICHLAVGLGCECVKFGIGGERVVKLNEMLRIEERI